MKRNLQLLDCPFRHVFLFVLFPILSYAGLGSPFTPSLIYPYLSYHREINETDVNYTCNLEKVWDRQL